MGVAAIIILTHIVMDTHMTDSLSLLKLLQLCSPTLPVGAFAYSQGLESAIETKLVTDKSTLQQWLLDALRLSLKQVDLPIFSRLYQAWKTDNLEQVLFWNQNLRAQRETHELREEDHHMGLALTRLLKDLGFSEAVTLHQQANKGLCFITLFTLAACKWRIPCEQAANGFIWSWLENQIAAGIKLVPLGQTDGQKLMAELLPELPQIVAQGLALKDEDIGASLPMMAILSAQHETQYSRLFRS